MADQYNLGRAHGVVEIGLDASGLKQAGPALDDVKKRAGGVTDSMNKASTGMLLMGGIIAGGLGLAIKVAADFEKQISAIGAVSGSTGSELDAVREKALQLGADTAYSASEAAGAIEELVKGGLTMAEVMGGAADATVDLAAATGIDLAQAATIASNAMNAFGIEAKDLTGVVDDIAGAANASAIDASEFGQSLSQVSAVANLAGLSFHDTAVAIAEMGNAGIKGSDAGTSLKTMLMNLSPATKKAREQMEELGIITADGSNKFFDQNGKARSLAEIQGVLATSLKGLSREQQFNALRTMFGTDAIRAAAVAAQNGAAGYKVMNDEMGKVSAAEVAKQRLDNLHGSIEQLKGSLETVFIQLGTYVIPVLSTLAETVTGVVNAFSGLPDPVKQGVVIVAVLAAGALLLVGATIKVVKWTKEFSEGAKELYGAVQRAALGVKAKTAAAIQDGVASQAAALGNQKVVLSNQAVGTSSRSAAVGMAVMRGAQALLTSAMGIAGIAIAAAGVGIMVWMQHMADAKARADSLSGSIDILNGKISATGKRTIFDALSDGIDKVHWEKLDELGLGMDEAVIAMEQGEGAVRSYIDKVGALESQMQHFGLTTGVVTNRVYDWSQGVFEAKKSAELAATASEATGSTIDEFGNIVEDSAGQVGGLSDEISDLTKMWDELNQSMSQQASMDKTKENLDAVSKLVKENTDKYKENALSLNSNSEAGRTNRDAIRGYFTDITKAAQDWGVKNGKSTEEVATKTATMMSAMRTELIDNGFNVDMIDKMMKGFDILPKQLNERARLAKITAMAGFTGVGTAVATGMAAGISTALPAVIGAVNKMTSAAIAAGEQGIDAHSPSRVFARLGGNVVEGFELGLKGLEKLKDSVVEPVKKLIEKFNEQLDTWVEKQKDKIAEAIDAWKDYRKTVITALSGNVGAGKAWEQTIDQQDAVKDATNDLTKAEIAYAKAVAQRNEAIAKGQAKATPDNPFEMPDAIDTSSLDAAKNKLQEAQGAVKTFEQNMMAQISESRLFGVAYQAAGNAMMAAGFGPDSAVWKQMDAAILELGPGAGTDMANYIVNNGLDPTMTAMLTAWDPWKDKVATQQADVNKKAGITAAINNLLGMEEHFADNKTLKKLRKMGVQINDGLLEGFKSGKGDWVAAINDYIETMGRRWEIHSPSKVTKTMGEQIAAGLVMGLQMGMPEYMKTLDGMAQYAQLSVQPFDAPGASLSPLILSGGTSSQGPVQVISQPRLEARIYVGDRELKEVIRTEIVVVDDETLGGL